ncbi:MAG: Transporter [Verrucomicrobiales bacterium]|nr:Transporter [Verrucomicrobiales bacterium]
MIPSSPVTRLALLSVAAAVLTFVLKLVAWQLTGSVTLLSDALESVANLAAALVAVASVTVSARPADEEHAYGHTKVEYFAGGVEGALILVAAAGIGWNAVDRLFHPVALTGFSAGLSVSVLASLVNLFVARLLLRAARRYHSVALEADGHHLMSDVWTSVAAVGGLLLVKVTGWPWLDPALGLLLAFHIVFTGIKLVHQSMLGLMDTGVPPEDLARIKSVLEGYAAQGLEWHALRTREAGARRFASVHLLVPGDWTVQRGHDLAEEVEAALREAVPRLNVLTHLEPIEDPASFRDAVLDAVHQ